MASSKVADSPTCAVVRQESAHPEGVVQFDHRTFPHIEPDCCGCCGPNTCETMSLELDDEEMIIRREDCCGTKSEQKRPYAQMGNVEETVDCCGTHFVKADGLAGVEGGGVAPGTACCHRNKAIVDDLVAELQARKIGRGNVAQVKEAEIMKQEVAFLHQKVDLILAHLQIAAPEPHVMAHRARIARRRPLIRIPPITNRPAELVWAGARWRRALSTCSADAEDAREKEGGGRGAFGRRRRRGERRGGRGRRATDADSSQKEGCNT